MSSLTSISPALTDCIDIVETAAATISRRLPAHVSTDDLISVGKLALISALSQCEGSVDEVRAFAFVRVRGAMLDELRRLDPLSRAEREKMNRVLRVQAELSGRLGRAATPSEIAAGSQLAISAVAEVLRAIEQESEFVDFDLNSLPDEDVLSPSAAVETDDLRASLRDALQRLTANQAAVLQRYYFDEATLEVIAAELGVSAERVRQIRTAGEKKLRADFTVLALWQSLISRDQN